MKYYSIKVNPHYYSGFGPIGDANGEKVPNGEFYFSQMRIKNNKILLDAPIFDYFFLENGSKPENWEWKLQDIHDFTGESPSRGCLVSDKFKKVLEQLYIMPEYHFYPSKLMYKGQKLDYWVFQYVPNYYDTLNYSLSIFLDEDTEDVIKNITDCDKLRNYRFDLDTPNIKCKKLVLTQPYDFLVLHNVNLPDHYVSEHFKNTIETFGIAGLLFEEIDFEIVSE